MRAASDIADSLGVMLRRGFRMNLYAELTADVHPGLDTSTYPVLSAVAQLGHPTAAAVANAIGLDRSVVSRRARALGDSGLLAHEENAADARQVLLALTPVGEAVIEATQRRLDTAIARRINNWPASDQHRFAELLRAFATQEHGQAVEE